MARKKQRPVEVDQAVRIEELNRDTIIGVGSKDQQHAFRLSRKTKRFLNEYFRKLGKPRQGAPIVFAAVVILALRKSNKDVTNIIIDTEYTGYEKLITIAVLGAFPKAVVTIRRIGKLSPAHFAAYGAHRGKKKATILTRKEVEMMVLAIRIQKDGRRTASPGMNQDSQIHNRPVNRQYKKTSRKSKRR